MFIASLMQNMVQIRKNNTYFVFVFLKHFLGLLALRAPTVGPIGSNDWLECLFGMTVQYMVCRTPSGKAFETIAKSIQKRCRINETTSLERWRRRNAIFFWGGRKPWYPRPKFRSSVLGRKIAKQMSKLPSTNHIKNEHPKTRTLMPKGYQKGDTHDAKTQQKTSIGNIMKII